MIDAIVATAVVFAIFCVVAALFAVYVWLADPVRAAARRAKYRARREAGDAPAS